MIGQIEGTIWQTRPRSVILGVYGIGYVVHVTDDTAVILAAKKDAVVRLWTHQAVREDSLDLFGFETETDLRLFELMIGISGIGPKKALSILSLAPAATLTKAIASGDTGYLTKVSGIGRKMADKIVLELEGKLAGLVSLVTGADLQDDADVLSAIQALGYSAHEARSALKEVPDTVTGIGERVKAALKNVGKK